MDIYIFFLNESCFKPVLSSCNVPGELTQCCQIILLFVPRPVWTSLAYFVWSCYSAGWMRYSPRTSQKMHRPHWPLCPAKQCQHVTDTLFKACGHIMCRWLRGEQQGGSFIKVLSFVWDPECQHTNLSWLFWVVQMASISDM